MSDTLRSHVEAILTETTINEYQQPPRETQERIREHAAAAIEIIDNAERPGLQDMYLGGGCSCEAPRSDCCTCDQGYALVPDPVPVVSRGDDGGAA